MNKKSIRIIFIAMILIIAILGTTLLTAQVSKVPKPRDIQGTVTNTRPLKYDKGKYGGTFLDFQQGDPKTFNESQSSDNTSSKMILMMSPYLFKRNYDTGKWELYLGNHKKGKEGKGYDFVIKDDGSIEIIMYLRKDIYWTDGTRMTADDWVFYHNEIVCNDDIGSQGNPGTYIEMPDGDEEQYYAEKIDRWTFKMIFPRTPGEPEFYTTYNIMPKHILKPILDSQGTDGIIEMWGMDTSPSKLIGYGPWIIDKYSIGENIVFKRNEKYFLKDDWNNRLPYLDNVIWNLVADTNVAMLKFKNKELDALSPISYADFPNLVNGAASGGYKIWNGGPATGIRFCVFNQNPNSESIKGTPKLKWFQQKEFRQAMSLLIDRETLVAQSLNSLGEPDRGIIHPASPYFDPNNPFPGEFNPDKAIKILNNIGIRDRNGDGILEDKESNNIKFEIMTNDNNPERVKATNIIAKDWKAYGIDVIPTMVEFNVLVDKLQNNFEWDAIVIGLTGAILPGGSNVWQSKGGLHMWNPLQDEPVTEWEAEIDRLFQAASYEPDFETRKALWNEMWAVIYDQMPIALLYRKYDFAAFYKKWGNVYCVFGNPKM